MLPRTAEEQLAFAIVWRELKPSVARFARVITADRDHQDDLVQEAMVALWNIQPTRYDFRDPADVAYVRRILINRMCDVWGEDASEVRVKTDAVVRGLVGRAGPG